MSVRTCILLYVDEARLRQTIQDTLSATYQIYPASNLIQASNLFEQEQIDVVLTEFRPVDVVEHTCTEFISSVQARSSQVKPQILLVSSIPYLAELFTHISPAATLRVPFSADQLQQFITQHLGTGPGEP